ncbi:MAG: hypothetical protein C5B59_00245 [Bacteroidetes bacterium]|nr:MAG: hypothetical protein C5B59_00245 [Bacteroidota bacterium]
MRRRTDLQLEDKTLRKACKKFWATQVIQEIILMPTWALSLTDTIRRKTTSEVYTSFRAITHFHIHSFSD